MAAGALEPVANADGAAGPGGRLVVGQLRAVTHTRLLSPAHQMLRSLSGRVQRPVRRTVHAQRLFTGEVNNPRSSLAAPAPLQWSRFIFNASVIKCSHFTAPLFLSAAAGRNLRSPSRTNGWKASHRGRWAHARHMGTSWFTQQSLG